MSEADGEAIAADIHAAQRVTELEIEVARMAAELEEARGGDSVAATSRFLMLAASTIDNAVADISSEAETAVTEARGEIQRLRTEAEQAARAARAEAEEAARVAMAEAEAAREAAAQVTVGARQELEKARSKAMTLAEEAAVGAEETQRHARNEADQIISTARNEASMAMVSERQRLDREVEALTGVREALIQERQALEDYHNQLQTRVRELAQAMVSFMTAGSGGGGLDALAKLTTPEIGSSPVDHGLPPMAPVPEPSTVLEDPPAVAPIQEPVAPTQEPVTPTQEPVTESTSETEDVTDEGYPAEAIESYEASYAPSEPRPIVEPIPPHVPEVDPTTVDEDPWRDADPSAPLGAPIFEDPIEASVLLAAQRDDEDLFGPARPGEGTATGPVSLARLFADDAQRGDYGARDENDAAEADAQFKDFIEGDVDDDASRAWFLRPDAT